MEAHSCRNKYLIYALLIAISWFLFCLLQFQFSHISVSRYSYLSSHRRAGRAALAVESSVSSSPQAVQHDDDGPAALAVDSFFSPPALVHHGDGPAALAVDSFISPPPPAAHHDDGPAALAVDSIFSSPPPPAVHDDDGPAELAVDSFFSPPPAVHHNDGPAALAVDSFFSSPPAVHHDDAKTRRSPSPSCEGRHVYMVDLPSQFNLLKDCFEGSPAFEDESNACVVMSNAGLGPALPPDSGSDTGSVIPENGWFNTNQHALEVIFHNRMRQYECLTDDPAAATAVYVPYYAGLEMYRHTCFSNATVRETPTTEFLRWLSSRPQWAALGGRDHFMVASKTTWMFRRDPNGDSNIGCGNSFLERPESGNMTVLTHESNIWVRRDMAVPYATYFHPSSAADVAAWQARVRNTRRPWLYAFAGARRPSSGLVLRGRITDKCVSSPSRCRMLDCSQDLEERSRTTCRSPEKVMSLFASSRFCLQPNGDSYMRRSSIDAVVAGCIPVFFHDASTFVKQYLWHEPDNNVDGRRSNYSVLIPRLAVQAGTVDIEEVLSRYSDEEVEAMREEVIKMIPRFLYKDPRVRFEGDMKDGFDIAMEGVMARTRRIRNGEDVGWWDQ